VEKMPDTGNQVLRLKRFSEKFICFDGERAFCNCAIHDARHENYRDPGQLGVILDELANLIAVLFRHNDVCDHNIRSCLLNFAERHSGIVRCDHIHVLTAKSDLDHFPHGRAIVNEIDGWDGSHQNPPSVVSSCSDSSSSRNAVNMSSVADRKTVRVAALSPGINLYEPESLPLQNFTIWTTASSPTWSPHSAWVTLPFSIKMIPSICSAFT